MFFDVEDSNDVQKVRVLDLPGTGDVRAEIVDDLLYYATAHETDVRIVDVSSPADSTVVARHSIDGSPGQAQRSPEPVRDDVDLLDRSAPPGTLLDFTVDGATLYLAASDLGFEVVDASDPNQTSVLFRQEFQERAIRVASDDSLIYVLFANGHNRERLDYRVVAYDLHSQQDARFVTEINEIRAAPGLQGLSAVNGMLFLILNDTLIVLEAGSDDGGQ